MTAPLATAEPGLLEHEGLLPPRMEDTGAARDRRGARRVWTAVVVVAVVWSLARSVAAADGLVNAGGWALVRRFLAAAVHPEVSGDFLRLTWDATLTTLSYAILGTALSVVVGVVFGAVSSQTWWQGRAPGRARGRVGGWLAARAALSLPRGVHEAVWGLFLIRILGLDPLVGVLAIAIPYGAVTAKVYAELLDETPGRAYAAVRGAGVGRLKALAYTLVPQALPDMVSYAFYRFECSIRAAAILGIIGAGGLGFQLALSFQSLRYDEMWTLIYALVLVSGLADWWSTSLRRRTRRGAAGAAHGRDRFLVGSGAAMVALVALAAWHLQPEVASLWAERTRSLFSDIAASSWPPDLDGASVRTLARLSLETLEMSLVATALATVGGVAMALAAAADRGGPAGTGSGRRRRLRDLAAAVGRGTRPGSGRRRRSGDRWPAMGRGTRPGEGRPGPGDRWAAVGRETRPSVRRSPVARAAAPAARAVLLFCRAIPPPVWALLFLFVLFPGPLPGALALGVYNAGILGRLMAEVVENLDDGPARALRASGANGASVLLYATLPAALPRFVAYSVYRWEVTIRETVIVGLVGAGGLGRLLSAQLTSFDYRGVTATLLALVLLTLLADLVGTAIRRSLR